MTSDPDTKSVVCMIFGLDMRLLVPLMAQMVRKLRVLAVYTLACVIAVVELEQARNCHKMPGLYCIVV